MPAILVPDLKRKFDLLRSYPARRTWPALAEPFGRTFKTLQSWQDGSATRDPGRVPDWAVPILIRLIGDILPGRRAADELQRFVFGPAALLEEEVRTGTAVTLRELIASEARRDTATLIRRDTGIELIEVDSGQKVPGARLKLGERFRIEFRRLVPNSYVVALQHAQQAWALLQLRPKPSAILVPGTDEQGEPSFMYERRDLGRHLFACLETPDPPPATLTALLREEVAVDKRGLGTLAEFYSGQPRAKRACHVLEVEIEAGDKP